MAPPGTLLRLPRFALPVRSTATFCNRRAPTLVARDARAVASPHASKNPAATTALRLPNLSSARRVHHGIFDYAKVEYVNDRVPVVIVCPTHGEFAQAAGRHLAGGGCPLCGRERTAKRLRLSAHDVDQRLLGVHGGNLVRIGEYLNSHTKCEFRCTACGTQRATFPMSVLKGMGIGCRCTNFRRGHTDFVDDARLTHGDAYDYGAAQFVGIHQPVKIICRGCGSSFYQTPANHIHNACGCPKCGRKRSAQARTLSVPEFLSRARAIHGDRYCYDLDTYVNVRTKMTMHCPEHGPFEQVPFNHLKGHRCNKCGSESTQKKLLLSISEVTSRLAEIHGNRLQIDSPYIGVNASTRMLCTVCGLHRKARIADLLNGDGIACKCSKTYRRNTELFIAEAIETHGPRRYDYSSSRFVAVKTPVVIRCAACGNAFEQTPEIHLQGCGCPNCATEGRTRCRGMA